jgi:hypothetical protein
MSGYSGQAFLSIRRKIMGIAIAVLGNINKEIKTMEGDALTQSKDVKGADGQVDNEKTTKLALLMSSISTLSEIGSGIRKKEGDTNESLARSIK